MTISYEVFKGSKDGSIHIEKVTRADLAGDEALVRMEASGVCGTDEHIRHSESALGHEGVGIVERVGERVFHIKVSVLDMSMCFDIKG